MIDTVTRFVLVGQVGSTMYMTGLIWFVQVVHYRLLAAVGPSEFPAYERRHTTLTTWVVAPPMLIEAATALLLFWFRPPGATTWQLAAGLALLVIVWLSTAFLQMPCHETLCRGFDAAAHQRLVWTNWARTISWSLRAFLVLWLTCQSLR